MLRIRKGNLIVLGLTDENVRQLKNGEPIKFELNHLLPDVKLPNNIDVIIMNGRDEQSMYLALKQLTTPQG